MTIRRLTIRRPLAIAATALAVAVAAPAPVAAGQHPGPPPDAAPAGDPPDDPPGGMAAGDEIVHSWALGPAGSGEAGSGNRPSLSYVADPGSVIEDAVTVYNYGSVQLTFHVYATDAFNDDAGELAFLPGDEEPGDVGSWVTFAQDHLTVLPGQQVTLPITVRIPAGAAPGDHVGAVLASNDEARGASPDGKVVTLDRRTGTGLAVRVNGPLRPELAVTDLRVDYDAALDPLGGTAHIGYRIENRGNVRLGGSHRASIAGPFGLGERRAAPAVLADLLPGESVAVVADVNDVPALVVAATTAELEPDPAGDGAGLATVRQTTTTFAPPVAIVALVLALGFGLLARRAHRRHRAGAAAADVEPDAAPAAPGPEREPQRT